MSEPTPEIKQLLNDLMETIWGQDVSLEQEFGCGDWETSEIDALQARVDAVIGDGKPDDPMSPTENIVTRPKEHSTLDGT